MSKAIQLDFNEIERSLWPALLILKADQPDAPAESILAEVAGRLRTIRARIEDEAPPERLRSPASTGDVINWLHSVWLELIAADRGKQLDRRRALIHRVLDSQLCRKDQSRLLTAVDYLSRLAEARCVARSVGTVRRAGAPSILSHAMQSAYRKLVGLACTSLPIWLAGEKGTELDWMAHLAHAIGGGQEDALRVRDFNRDEGDPFSINHINDQMWGGSDTTLVARRADRAPKRVQQQLHEHLAGRLAEGPETRVIVTSEPIDVTDGAEKGLYVDLFAFLYPSMILVPPLRNRIEDIAPLMTFLATKRNASDPVPRMTSEVMQALQRYHWPTNVQELETVTRFVLERRPAGEIGLRDLPESVRRAHAVPQSVLDALREIHRAEGFRILSTEAGRRGVGRFLTEPHGTSFGALDFMKAFNQGRETTRRIMASFISKGIVEPVKGPTQQRTTSYRRAALSEPPVDE